MHRILLSVAGFIGLCLILAAISAISNQNLPGEESSDRLSVLDKARVQEAVNLKSGLGDQVWPGWGSENIPIIVWNRSFEFLTNYQNEAPSDWKKMTDEDLNGEVYFHRKADNPQNFAVRVGDVWVASMASKQTTDVFMIESFQNMLPSPVKQVFPYRVLLQASETQMGGLLHETFHVYQYRVAPIRMDEAELAHRLGDRYEIAFDEFSSEWKSESNLLADALDATTLDEKIDRVREFLSMRDARRDGYQLNRELVDYERWLEWEEGTAKYIELAILKTASESAVYQPLPEMKNDPDFKAYQGFDQRWSQEIFPLRYQTSPGETRFYMSGMAQAFLLDSLMPTWKDKYWDEGVFLEDLLRMAVKE